MSIMPKIIKTKFSGNILKGHKMEVWLHKSTSLSTKSDWSYTAKRENEVLYRESLKSNHLYFKWILSTP